MFVFPVFLVFGANAASAQWGATRMDLGQRAKALAPVIRVTPPTSPPAEHGRSRESARKHYGVRSSGHTYPGAHDGSRESSLFGSHRERREGPGRPLSLPAWVFFDPPT